MGLLCNLMVPGGGHHPHGAALLLTDVWGGPTGQGLLDKGVEEGQAGIYLQVFTGGIQGQCCLLDLPACTAHDQDVS